MSVETVNPRLPVAAIGAGVVAALVGFGSSFPIIIQGLVAIGATDRQAASGLMALSIAMGLSAVLLTLRHRIPVSIAWSTPGAALMISTGAVEGGFAAALGAIMLTGVLIVVAGIIRPFRDLVAKLPSSLANAMLAGILLKLCLAPVEALAVSPQYVLPVIVIWLIVLRFARLYAMPVAVAAVAVIIIVVADLPVTSAAELLPDPVVITPTFNWSAIISLTVPLFIVTMASQNIPGIAVLRAYGYPPHIRDTFIVTGAGTFLGAPFGGHAINYAAMTAAICAGPESDPDPGRRWVAAFTAGVLYILLGCAATFATVLIAASPPMLIQAVAGLALLGALGSSLLGAMQEPADRDAAILTFIVAASGMSFFGIGAAFWGLVAGVLVLGLSRWRRGGEPKR